MLYYTNLKDIVFNMQNNIENDAMTIISGYVGPEPIYQLSKQIGKRKATIIYGMYGYEKIAYQLHESLKKLQKQLPNIEIRYSLQPVHAKLYLWTNKDFIEEALIGSANFSVSGLQNDYKEVLADLANDDFNDLADYADKILKNSIICTEGQIRTKSTSKAAPQNAGEELLKKNGICRVTLLTKEGIVAERSGLNWGVPYEGRAAHVAAGDAYIRIPRDIIKNYPDFFPPKKYVDVINTSGKGKITRQNDEIELIWDDGTVMVGLLEGNQKIDGIEYPKQLSSSPSKNILGKYIRKRLGKKTDEPITRDDLTKYGRTNIDISMLGEGEYYMDFSQKK